MSDSTDNQQTGSAAQASSAGEQPQPVEIPSAEQTPRKPLFRFKNPVAGAPIVGFTGVNGAGKTALAVAVAICDLALGRRVVSTVPITSPWGNSQPLTSWTQLMHLKDTTVLIDEAGIFLDSSEHALLPAAVRRFLGSMRHGGNTLLWTAPAWSNVHNRLRQVTQVVVSVVPLIKRTVAGEFWPRPYLVGVGIFDVTGLKQDETPEKPKRRRFFRLKKLPSIGSYDTHADVVKFGYQLETGVCIDCGGKIKTVYCTPERHLQIGLGNDRAA